VGPIVLEEERAVQIVKIARQTDYE